MNYKRTKQIGENKIVELEVVNEAEIRKRKYNTGRIIRGQWVVGIDRDTHNVFIVPVLNRNIETILLIIQKYVAHDSIIHIDKWRAYDVLQNENYTHLTINYSENFVDPITNVHTQNIERLWREMRANSSLWYSRLSLQLLSCRIFI